MNQRDREPDLSTNVPHGASFPDAGHSNMEHDVGERQNEPIEPTHDQKPEEGSVEHASAGTVRSVEETPRTQRSGEPPPRTSVDRLNDLLRAELASVETYDLALKRVRDAELASALRQIRESHDRRAALLREKIRSMGGLPAPGSGVWGAFARLVQRGADLLGNRAALAALEEGEDQGKKRYTRDLDELDEATRQFVLHELSPEQMRTHDLAQSLKRVVNKAA
jgi:uncharacterized protein (TIGR02284 family)